MGFLEPYQELENKFAEFTGSKYAVSCNSGTSALHLALMALRVSKGDEVIIPDFTMAAVAFAVSYTGAKPIFGDVDLKTYGLLPSEVKRLRTKRTKAVIAVHTYGRLADIDGILKEAKGVPVIEDACEAQGAIYNSKAEMTCYSFYRNKIIRAEEGGMVTANKKCHIQRMRYLKNMCFGPKHNYYHKEVGYNYRMPNGQALMALQSLTNYPKELKRRQKREAELNKLYPMPKRNAVWFYEAFGAEEERKKPENRMPFKPISSFPMYGGKKGLKNSRLLSKKLTLIHI